MAAADNASSSSKAADMLFVERGTGRFLFTRSKKAPFSDDTSLALEAAHVPQLEDKRPRRYSYAQRGTSTPVFLDGRKLPPLAGTVFLHFHLGPKTVPKAVRCNSGGVHKGNSAFRKAAFGGVGLQKSKNSTNWGFWSFGFCILKKLQEKRV